ncbi:Trypsin domain protein [Moritella viscosa]|uniref:Trypsin domain protein n=1 Tax=Moritella viscosa TaxID=80854 RepID=A0A1L0E8Y7_9GAMM|nr:trypsin-like serine protease [Moritella viscosa]SGY95388.1 Trypsin domain protein [Moritella viscosa]SGY95794.1 Trypsin domain protein [Moritella viscosa]SGZ00395.1 Trypsin domain protein [Moritella viscosa]SHO06308.1 Trypsin domain protein [Moritella viscosa]SHO06325.1 Trypsin domain protein [Moritella viscosa]
MVALVSKNRDVYSGQFCGASFLGGRYILTAAHCVDSKEGQDFDAVIGISDLAQNDAAARRYSVKEVYVHEDYWKATAGNDIAILELEREINYTAVNLADRHLRNSLPVGKVLTVMGWGDQDPKPGLDNMKFKNELYQVDVPLVEQALCPGGVSLKDNAFCAGYLDGGYDSCQGDSGGPIVVASANGYEQLGIVSWGDGCAEAGNYGVYANVSHFSDWISGKMQGFSYRQSEFVGAKRLGAYSHTFTLQNNTEQVIRTLDSTIQGVGASITSNTCSEIAVNASCAVTINYTVSALDFGNVSVSISTDYAQASHFDMAVSYIGIETASSSVSNMISVTNSGIYSSANSWFNNGHSIESPVLGNNEYSQLAITGLVAGKLSFNGDISIQEYDDYFNIYINGHLHRRVSGIESDKFTIGLSRDNNTVVFEYRKSSYNSYGDDRITISNLTHSAFGESTGESTRPDGNSTNRSSAGSGGAINWITLLVLSMLALFRRRLV